MDLRAHLGDIDIYLLDQVLKGRIAPGMHVLDAGCGGGRNLRWMLGAGCRVAAVDRSPEAVEQVRAMVRERAPDADPDRIRVATVQALPFADAEFDAVLCMAVLHFAERDEDVHAAVRELWRVLKPGGMLLVRLASTISVEPFVRRVSETDRRYLMPSGKTLWLADLELLLGMTETLGGELLEPVKTTNVQNARAMTTWVVGKRG